MSKLSDSAKVAMKAQTALVKAELKRNKIAVVLYVVMAGCFLLGLVAINIAGFYMMTENDVARNAAACIGLFNLMLGCIPALLASRLKASDEEKLLVEIRDQASSNLTQPFSSSSSPFDKVGMAAPLLNLALKNFQR